MGLAEKQEVNDELDSLSYQLLVLSQDLIQVKLQLEEQSKLGFIGLAQSRKLMGGSNSVSHLQIPSEDSTDFIARFKTKKEEQKCYSGDATFDYFSLQDGNIDQLVEELDSDLVLNQRKKQDDTKETEANSCNTKKNLPEAKDPIKWFGVLVPNSLRQTQGAFVKALELSVDCANIQNQIKSTIERQKYLSGKLKE